MELSSAIREDYCHRLDSEKDRVKGKKSRATVRETHRATENIQKKKGFVDKRVVKIVRADSKRHFECRMVTD